MTFVAHPVAQPCCSCGENAYHITCLHQLFDGAECRTGGHLTIVGTILKCVIKCLMRSNGYRRKSSRRIFEAKSSMLSMFCRLSEMEGRPDAFTALATRLDLPNLRGLISTKWFSLSSILWIVSNSLTLSVKNSSSTSVPNLNGFFMSHLFAAKIRKILETTKGYAKFFATKFFAMRIDTIPP